MADPASRVSIGQKFDGKYVVRRVLGAGGMGAVYEVEHLFTRRIGALKLLHESYSSAPQVVERFIREASAAGRIDNPHIVETMDAGKFESGEPYMFMELLSGTPINDLIERRQRLRLDEALEIVIQAAEGLAAAHATGIVHRDIKPDNLFLCRGDEPFVKILDFGISKFTVNEPESKKLTADGAALGTPYYMSPEQVLGSANVDERTDIYSLGVVLYECLTGQVPFQADALPALCILIHQGKYVPMSDLVDVPARVEAVVSRAMAVDPAQRYASMQEFREALIGCRSGKASSLAPTRLAASAEAKPNKASVAAVSAPPSATAGGSTTENPSDALEAASDTFAATAKAESSGESRHSRQILLVAALAVLGVGAAVALGIGREGRDTTATADTVALDAPAPPATALSPSAEAGKAAVPTAPSALTRPVRAPASAAASSEPPSQPLKATNPTMAPQRKGSTPRAAESPPGGQTKPPSRAARDGLSVENPFSQ